MQVQEAQRVPNKIDAKRPTPRQFTDQMLISSRIMFDQISGPPEAQSS